MPKMTHAQLEAAAERIVRACDVVLNIALPIFQKDMPPGKLFWDQLTDKQKIALDQKRLARAERAAHTAMSRAEDLLLRLQRRDQ